MRLTDLIYGVRHQINDLSSTHNGDAAISFWLNRAQQDLFRRRVEADPSYSRLAITFSAGDTARVKAGPAKDWWRYYLPSWEIKVRGVYQVLGSDRQEVEPRYWRWSSNRSIDVRCGGTQWPLSVDVAKTPALMRRGSVAAVSTRTDELVIARVPGSDSKGQAYQSEFEDGCLLEAQIELTASDAVRGAISTVVGQKPDVVGGVDVWVLTVFPAFPDMAQPTDTYEIHSEIEDVHAEYVVLVAAESLFARNVNTSALEALRPRLARCERRFVAAIQPRTNGIARFIETTEDYGAPSPFSRDRDNELEF